MKKVIDNFSRQSQSYKKFRPHYPSELYELILVHTEGRTTCWDCATGNGQVAVELASHFDRVFATDISEQQLELAEKRDNITYLPQRAESTTFESNLFDLITVAQAAHWFDMVAFINEATRVAKNGATVALWGYGLIRADAQANAVFDQLYEDVLGDYWDPERVHIDNEYRELFRGFEEIMVTRDLSIEAQWDIDQLLGFFQSWSSVSNYKARHGKDPVAIVASDLRAFWKDQKHLVRFPIFLYIGRVKK